MQINVNKEQLRVKLQKNRAEHKELFDKAWKGYIAAALDELSLRIKDIENGKNPNLYISLPAPEDHTEDYDRALDMLEWSVGDTFSLTEIEFDQYINDEWHWKANFLATSVGYVGELGEAPKR